MATNLAPTRFAGQKIFSHKQNLIILATNSCFQIVNVETAAVVIEFPCNDTFFHSDGDLVQTARINHNDYYFLRPEVQDLKSMISKPESFVHAHSYLFRVVGTFILGISLNYQLMVAKVNWQHFGAKRELEMAETRLFRETWYSDNGITVATKEQFVMTLHKKELAHSMYIYEPATNKEQLVPLFQTMEHDSIDCYCYMNGYIYLTLRANESYYLARIVIETGEFEVLSPVSIEPSWGNTMVVLDDETVLHCDGKNVRVVLWKEQRAMKQTMFHALHNRVFADVRFTTENLHAKDEISQEQFNKLRAMFNK